MDIVKEVVQKAVVNLQVFAGQYARAEAALHAMRELYNDKDCEAVFNTLNKEAMIHNIGILYPILTKLCAKYL